MIVKLDRKRSNSIESDYLFSSKRENPPSTRNFQGKTYINSIHCHADSTDSGYTSESSSSKLMKELLLIRQTRAAAYARRIKNQAKTVGEALLIRYNTFIRISSFNR